MERTSPPPSALTERQAASSRTAAIAVTIGALMVIGGVWLPYVSSPDSRVEIVDASVFAAGPGRAAILGALTALALALGRWRGTPMPWGIPSMVGLFGVIVAGFWVTDVNAHSLYEIAYRGPFHASTSDLEPGLGIWVVGGGALVITLGGLFFSAVPLEVQRAVAAAKEPGLAPVPLPANARPAPHVAHHAQPGQPPAAAQPPAPPAPEAPRPRSGAGWDEAREAPERRWAPPAAPGSLPAWDDSTRPTSH